MTTASSSVPTGVHASDLKAFVGDAFEHSIVPLLTDYIRIPNKSQNFDAAWHANGHMQRAAELLLRWAQAQPVQGMQCQLFALPGLAPTVLCEIQGNAAGNVLLYGHYDKQPEFTGWRDGLGPWTPVLQNGRLYGRGGADDGYALPCSLTAIAALQRQGVPLPRCFVLIEGGEESGSPDLPLYMDALRERIGTPDLVVCLDAECGSYDRWWVTTSLRGLAIGNLNVAVLKEGVHSGAASGIIPSSFRIVRDVLERLENARTGHVLDDLHVTIPPEVRAQAADTAAILGDEVFNRFPRSNGLMPVNDDLTELVLNNTWRPMLAVTGASGLPLTDNAGNTLRPNTQLKLSMRLPPTMDARSAGQVIKKTLTRQPPYGAEVTYDLLSAETGWWSPVTPDWVRDVVAAASARHFGNEPRYMGTGGTIPFMKMLGDRFPKTAFLVTGVLGPQSNAHGPNEFLHLECAQRVTCCTAEVLAALPARI